MPNNKSNTIRRGIKPRRNKLLSLSSSQKPARHSGVVLDKKTFLLICLMGFLISLSYALPNYVQSSFLNQLIPLPLVSLFISLTTLIALVAIIFYPKLIKKISNYRSMIFLFILTIASFLLIGLGGLNKLVLIAFVIHYIGLMMLFISLDIILENISDNEHTGRIRSAYISTIALSGVIAPTIMGVIVADNHYNSIYLYAGFILLLALFTAYFFKKNLNDHQQYEQRSLKEIILKLKNDANLQKAFTAGLTLRVFFAIMVLYVPIHLHQNFNFSWPTLGIIFTIMLLPFMLFEIPAGRLADKKLGEKEIMMSGLVIMAVAVYLIFMTHSFNPIIWAAILFFSRMGAALLESGTESYFFKKIGPADRDLIFFFRDLRPLGWLIGSLLSAIILFFLPLQFVFLGLIGIILLCLTFIQTLVDTK